VTVRVGFRAGRGVPALYPDVRMQQPFGSFGVVGYGHFGAFLARSLAEHGKVLVCDADDARLSVSEEGVRAAPIEEVAQADVVVVAVPFGSFATAVGAVRDQLRPETVVMDVVSTKERATRVLQELLADHPNVLATHPLFGPPSMARVEPGQRIVITYEKGPGAAALRAFLASGDGGLGLHVIERTPEEHDEAMAYMQALPFFIARALVALDLPHNEDVMAIPSYEKLSNIAEIEKHHTEEMFLTSQLANPYAERVRTAFLVALRALDDHIRDVDASA
jgi:prephenate dehydrogenase